MSSLPDKIFGIDIEEAYQKILSEKEPDKPPRRDSPSNPRTKKQKAISIQGVNLADYIFMPSYDLYVAKERILQGKNWFDAHKEAHKQNARMLTIREFVDFLNQVKEGKAEDGLGNKISKSELDKIYKDITEQRNPWRSEWLDADFKVVNGVLQINYNHKIVNKKLVPQNSEPLESCLMQDRLPGIDIEFLLKNANKQGFPPTNIPGGDLWYFYPRGDNNSVARFYARAGRVDLGCNWDPLNSYSAFGVRLAKIFGGTK